MPNETNSSCPSSVLLNKLQAMQVLAPAKINLSLKILARQADGFHEIETFISPISLYDELKIDHNRRGQGIRFSCNDPSVPQGNENLAVRAAILFFETTKFEPSVSIHLTKKIPHGAGLGGGSSDAASTLLALNELFGAKMLREELTNIGGTIGSDVPFFIFAAPAICRGRGEIVSPLKLPARLSILLLKPDFGVPSAWAYSKWKDSRKIPGIAYGAQEYRRQTFVNDLER